MPGDPLDRARPRPPVPTYFEPRPGSNRYYRIEAGDAAVAVNEFSRQSNMQVLFDFNVLRGIKTTAIEGSYTPSEALRRMLRGTGLQFDWVNDHLVAIELGKLHRQGSRAGDCG